MIGYFVCECYFVCDDYYGYFVVGEFVYYVEYFVDEFGVEC